MSKMVFPARSSGSEAGVPQGEPGRTASSESGGGFADAQPMLKCPECQQMWQPGLLICPRCGEVLVALAKPTEAPDTNVFETPEETIICPDCQQSCAANALVCSFCGHLFVTGEETNQLDEQIARSTTAWWMAGQVYVDNDKPITLEIEDKQVSLPIMECVIVGRTSTATPDLHPHIRLNEFDAHSHGVSRQHLKIIRKDGLICVSDLGSSNGTFLNGRRLVPHSERVLRNGDELRLGNLKLRIRF